MMLGIGKPFYTLAKYWVYLKGDRGPLDDLLFASVLEKSRQRILLIINEQTVEAQKNPQKG
jgi:hypothetical protein